MSDRLVLGIDTSTAVSVGLARGAAVLGTATNADRMSHAEQLLPLVQQVCRTAAIRPQDLDLVVVGLGPGPFTGLRVGIVTARVLASVLPAALHGVCSLDVIAASYAAEQRSVGAGRSRRVAPPSIEDAEFVVATDARRREVYWARYDAEGTRLDGPSVSPPNEVPRLPTVGPGADAYPDALAAVLGPRVLDPGVLAVVGPGLPSAGEQPLYLRRPDAAEPTRRKPVLLRRPDR